jgi:Phage ABA sandwich domain
VSELAEGRELDIIVATKVMGLKCCTCSGRNLGLHITPDGIFHSPGCLLPYAASYSTDIAAAFQALEKAFPVDAETKSGFPMILHRFDGWIVTLAYANCAPMEVFGRGPLLLAIAETAQLAICRASLEAIGHDP